MTKTRALTAAAFAATFALATAGTATAANISFEMDVLPSSAGATYVTNTGQPETDFYSLAGVILSQDTSGTSGAAYYQIDNIYDASRPASLSYRAKAQAGGYGMNTSIISPTEYYVFSLFPDGLYQGKVSWSRIVAMDTTDAFHEYELRIPAFGGSFDLYVDGLLRYSGTPYLISVSDNYIYFGDGTNGGGGVMQWDYLRFSNAPASVVPLPGAAMLFAPALAAMAWIARRRQ